jgi:hypothetical protein
MAAPTTTGGPQIGSGSVAHLTIAPEASPSEHPEVVAWLAEAKRLFAEAEDRFEAGLLLPALSSLAAVPPLDGMLVERCSKLLDAAGGETEDAPPSGMYL